MSIYSEIQGNTSLLLVVSLSILGTVVANLVQDKRELVEQNTTEIHLEYVLLDEDNPCVRTCIQGAAPMICRYHFKMEWYHTVSKACYNCPLNSSDCFRPDCIPGDGHKRAVVTINRQIPGPMIQVCQGDMVVVDVTNMLGSEATTIHWHGQHQKEYPYMDGVPYVTQCPILPHETFRYAFKAKQAGTHFWHSHLGMQRADGAYGAFIVRIPEEENPQYQFYDYDLPSHVMVVLDWEKETGLEKFLAHHHNDDDNKPTTLLVNGLGRFKEFIDEFNTTVYTPTARFKVKQGYRYRFRVINAGFLNCPIEISVDNHTIKVISSDGSDIAPVDATSLVTYAGERFDFILKADQEPDLYWIRFRGLMDCDERFKRAHQVAVLEYEGLNTTIDDYPDSTPNYDDSHREGTQINALNRGTESNETFISMPQLESLEKWDVSLKSKPDIQYYLAYDFYTLDNSHFHKAPHYGFFNKTMAGKGCEENYCECTHGLEVPLNSVVELVFVDEGVAYDANHPLHLHGHSFRVVAMERLGQNVTVEEVKSRDERGLIKRNLLDAPLKDTVTVPDGGFWIFHCHIEFHTEIGMAVVLKVGETSDMLPVPKNFPRCGDYLPEPVTECVGSDCDTSCDSNSFLNHVESFFGEGCSKASVIDRALLYIAICIVSIAFLR
ncbi:hypothetical protein NQ315_005325 [Exocentrus adspersus]|uniref:Uncharacterized protein n=1 Tax=Exocentrus adspersus TaxID=1586481 RepID=A0AAV8W2G3_9CUCU|nr:hypothetical protein NQ315_005325 [Exocentrus adspersus]